MSLISATTHHNSLRPRLLHSATRSGEASSLRLARLAADLSNGIYQQTPRVGDRDEPFGYWMGVALL